MACDLIQKGKGKEKRERKYLKKEMGKRYFPLFDSFPFSNDVTWHFRLYPEIQPHALFYKLYYVDKTLC